MSGGDMATKADYYELLGVGRTANAEEMKKAYRQAALRYHPDRNPGDKAAEEKFKELSEAYQVLTDSEKRAQYDRYGHAGVENVHELPRANLGRRGNAGAGA